MRDSVTQILPASGKADLVITKAMENVQGVAQSNRSGDYQGAWDTWEKISPKAHKNRIILIQGYMADFHIYGSSLEDTTEVTGQLLKIVSIMEEQFPGDAGLAIMQFRIHEINKDSKKYREAVKKIRN